MGALFPVLDTAADVRQQMVERWRAMTPAERLAQVADLNEAADQLAAAGVRRRFPGLDEGDVRRHVLALRLGRDTMIEVYGWDPDAGV